MYAYVGGYPHKLIGLLNLQFVELRGAVFVICEDGPPFLCFAPTAKNDTVACALVSLLLTVLAGASLISRHREMQTFSAHHRR